MAAMPNYRRARVRGGTFFFTVAGAERGTSLLTENVGLLRASYRRCARERPFRTEAIVILPDHLHAVWTLPPGDEDFSGRWMRIKAGVSRGLEARPRSASKAAKREKGVWQRRFWERHVRDEDELAATLRYVWTDPVRHGLATRALDWPWSSVHRDVRAGRLPLEGP
jgi:putative transposase